MNTDLFHIFAEVAVGYAGFVTIAAIISERRRESLIVTRVISLLSTAVIVILFSLFPDVVSGLGYSIEETWVIAGVFLFMVLLVYWLYILIRIRRTSSVAQMPWTNRVNTFIGYPVCFFVLASIVLGAFEAHSGSLYALVLFILLCFSSIVFVQNVHALLADSERSSG